MNASGTKMFEFRKFEGRTDQAVESIRRFAAHEALRSATVDELELGDEFHRRALRPEDLAFIKFSGPVTAATVTQLGFLAAQRLMSSIHEIGVAGLPPDGTEDSFARVARFNDDEHAVLGAQVLPFLESFAFDFLESEEEVRRARAHLVDYVREALRNEASFWRNVFERLVHTKYLEDGLRFAMLQVWSLAPSKRAALGRAMASRFFEPLPASVLPRLSGDAPSDGAVHELAVRCGVRRLQHAYWQFYLSTSLARSNLLYSYARRPDRALRLYGAAYAAEAEWLAFGCLVGAASARFGLGDLAEGAGGAPVDDYVARFERMTRTVERLWGDRGTTEVARGLASAVSLGRVARQNLGEQLRWLSSMETHREIARRIDGRVRAECPNIDRETFVEPREMCSTTHVHDDHRLVVIESGNMVFWGNLGMQLRLAPGEMVLVPQGRLHGSSIESPECTYHQPIIPEQWVRALVAELDPTGNAL